MKFRVLYRGKRYDEPLPLSFAEEPISNKGIQGARLYIKEANQSGALRRQESHLLHIAIEMKLEHAVAPCLIPPDGLPNVREVISANLRGG